MTFPKEFFQAVEQSEAESVIVFLEKDDKKSDPDQIFDSVGTRYHQLSALAIAVSHLTETSRTSSILSKDCIEIILHLLIKGANTEITYHFADFPSDNKITPFTYLCLKGDLNTVKLLFEYFKVTEDERLSIIKLLKEHQADSSVIKFLENPCDYTYLYPESYKKLANSKAKLVESAQLILKDYYAPLVLEFLKWPTIQRLLTFHANRHQDNLILAEGHVKGIDLRKSELEIMSKMGSDMKVDDLLLQEYISRLLRLNNFIVFQIENQRMNPKGSFCRRVHFLNQQLVQYVIDEQRKSARATPITPNSLFQPVQAEVKTVEAISLKPMKVNFSRLPCGKQTVQDLIKVMNLVEDHIGTATPFHTLSESSYLNRPI